MEVHAQKAVYQGMGPGFEFLFLELILFLRREAKPPGPFHRDFDRALDFGHETTSCKRAALQKICLPAGPRSAGFAGPAGGGMIRVNDMGGEASRPCNEEGGPPAETRRRGGARKRC